MARAPQAPPKSSSSSADKSKYIQHVNGRAGWRVLFFAVAIAGIAGLSVRLYFNPDRIRGWLDQALMSQGAAIGLKFSGARLELAHGSVPQLAVEMTGVEASPAGDCGLEPSIRIARLRVPLSFAALFEGRLAVGTVSAENLIVDIDGVKVHCPARASQPPPHLGTVSGTTTSAAPESVVSENAKPWWAREQLVSIQRMVGGFEFSQVELEFESKTKKIYLESLFVEPGDEPGALNLKTALIVPPELTYGERLPQLDIEVHALPTTADVRLKAGLSEGSILATAKLEPAKNGGLTIDAHASVRNVPLSMLEPLVTKSGMVKGSFHPRFMWMNCQTSVHGRFQGLLNENPLTLDACEIVGGGARIQLAHAVRKPNGEWEPLQLRFDKVEIARIMETFDWHGPDGVFSDFGRVTGEVNMRSAHDGEAAATIEGAQLRISSRNVRAVQAVKTIRTHLELHDERLQGAVDGIELDGGSFDGSLQFWLENHMQQGTAHLSLKSLRLSDPSSQILFGGLLQDVSGKADGRFQNGKLASVNGQFVLEGLQGREFRFAHLTASTSLANNGEFQLHAQAPHVSVNRGSTMFTAFKPIFFQHEFGDEWVEISDVLARAHLPSGGGLRWQILQGGFENGRIRASSIGAFSRERELQGFVNIDYPGVKNLRWILSGTTDVPALSEDSRTSSVLQARGHLDDIGLGLTRPSQAKSKNEED